MLDLTPSLYRSLSKQDDSRKLRLGLIAEDVAEHFPLAAVYDAEGRPDAVDWNPVIAGLIAEVKELKATVAELQSRH